MAQVGAAAVLAALYPASRLLYCRPLASWWEVQVGLEVHTQVATASKLFSGAAAGVGAATLPNDAASWIDAAHPGTLPRPNRGAVAAAVRAGLAVHGTINKVRVACCRAATRRRLPTQGAPPLPPHTSNLRAPRLSASTTRMLTCRRGTKSHSWRRPSCRMAW